MVPRKSGRSPGSRRRFRRQKPSTVWVPRSPRESPYADPARGDHPLRSRPPPVPPPRAGLRLPEPAHPPSPGAPPPALGSTNGRWSRCLAPPRPPRPRPPGRCGLALRVPGRVGPGPLGVAGDALRDRKAARAPEADVCARAHMHTASASGDLRGSLCQLAGVPSCLRWVELQPAGQGSRALLHRGNHTPLAAASEVSGPRDPMGWHMGRARAARRGRGLALV